VFKIILKNNIKPKKVLEIGSSTGFLLEGLRLNYNCKAYGIDTSKNAIAEGKKLFKKINLTHGMFENSKLKKLKYDLIICGFFLFMLPPKKILNLFSIIDESLNPGGHLIINDFFNKNKSFKIKDYKHEKRLKVYRWDYKQVFLSLPYYYKKDIHKVLHLGMKDFVETSLLKKKF
jgi:SAM-dependent methyltransferase